MAYTPLPSTGERLARVEERLDQLVTNTENLHADLRGHLAWQQRAFAAQNDRIQALDLAAAQTRTHLRWMKAVFAAGYGALLALLGLK